MQIVHIFLQLKCPLPLLTDLLTNPNSKRSLRTLDPLPFAASSIPTSPLVVFQANTASSRTWNMLGQPVSLDVCCSFYCNLLLSQCSASSSLSNCHLQLIPQLLIEKSFTNLGALSVTPNELLWEQEPCQLLFTVVSLAFIKTPTTLLALSKYESIQSHLNYPQYAKGMSSCPHTWQKVRLLLGVLYMIFLSLTKNSLTIRETTTKLTLKH